MAVITFDTLKLADKRQAGGFTSEQARTAASAFADSMSGADLVTNDHLDAKLAETKADILKSVVGMIVGAVAINVLAILAGMIGLAKLLGH